MALYLAQCPHWREVWVTWHVRDSPRLFLKLLLLETQQSSFSVIAKLASTAQVAKQTTKSELKNRVLLTTSSPKEKRVQGLHFKKSAIKAFMLTNHALLQQWSRRQTLRA